MSQTSQKVSIRQNFHQDSELLLNELINSTLFCAYTCKSMAYYFDRDDIGLYGMADLNRLCARESYNCAKMLMDYIVVRGGRVVFDDVKKPEKDEWGTPLDSLEYLLNLKQTINELVLKCHNSSHEKHDPHLNDFIETEILRPLVVFIRKVGVLISNLKRAGPNLGEYEFNKDLKRYLKKLMSEIEIPVNVKSRIGRQIVPTIDQNLNQISVKELIPVVEQIIENIQ